MPNFEALRDEVSAAMTREAPMSLGIPDTVTRLAETAVTTVLAAIEAEEAPRGPGLRYKVALILDLAHSHGASAPTPDEVGRRLSGNYSRGDELTVGTGDRGIGTSRVKIEQVRVQVVGNGD